MSMNLQRHREMLQHVAEALGAELRTQMAFVGGCTTGLLLTDAFSQEQVRHTDDVDLIVHVLGYADYDMLQQRLRQRGFRDSLEQQDPICTMRLGALRVDFMPDDASVLGFGNQWYAEALQTAASYMLTETLSIRLIHPVYFVATKLEAYHGRGQNDPIGSQDIEDLLNLAEGRAELFAEIQAASNSLKTYIGQQFSALLIHDGFADAIQDCTRGDQARADLLFERLENIVKICKSD
jgi:predicted nucleotidyltransferase